MVQLENEYGYNGYNLWVTSELVKEKGEGDEGLWRGGGYEGTHFWIDPKRDFVGVIMSQMFETPKFDLSEFVKFAKTKTKEPHKSVGGDVFSQTSVFFF